MTTWSSCCVGLDIVVFWFVEVVGPCRRRTPGALGHRLTVYGRPSVCPPSVPQMLVTISTQAGITAPNGPFRPTPSDHEAMGGPFRCTPTTRRGGRASDHGKNAPTGRPDSARPGWARFSWAGLGRLGWARLGWLGSARLGSARLGSARLGSARLDSTGPSPLRAGAPRAGRVYRRRGTEGRQRGWRRSSLLIPRESDSGVAEVPGGGPAPEGSRSSTRRTATGPARPVSYEPGEASHSTPSGRTTAVRRSRWTTVMPRTTTCHCSGRCAPKSAQCRMWWASHQWAGASQPGKVQCRSRSQRALS